MDEKQTENMKHCSRLGSVIRNGARCTGEVKSIIAMAKAAFQNKKTLFTIKMDFISETNYFNGTVEHSLL